VVLVFMGVAFIVTIAFGADVDAQGGAYATGVLVLITSASVAVTISVWNQALRWPFLAIALVFAYTTAMNVFERPEGIRISSFFIAAMIGTSLLSRALRSTELRITEVVLDPSAVALIEEDEDQIIRLIARRPRRETAADLDRADAEVRAFHGLSPEERVYFFEVERGDVSDFEHTLHVAGKRVGRHAVFCAISPVTANALAAMLIHLERMTGQVPHAYFSWTEGNPIGNLLKFLIFGGGDVAPIVREVLRRAIPDPAHRPIVHVS